MLGALVPHSSTKDSKFCSAHPRQWWDQLYPIQWRLRGKISWHQPPNIYILGIAPVLARFLAYSGAVEKLPVKPRIINFVRATTELRVESRIQVLPFDQLHFALQFRDRVASDPHDKFVRFSRAPAEPDIKYAPFRLRQAYGEGVRRICSLTPLQWWRRIARDLSGISPPTRFILLLCRRLGADDRSRLGRPESCVLADAKSII